MPEFQDGNDAPRAAVYIDGFNMYHPINEMGEPFLKWCDYWRLSENLCAHKGLHLTKVVFCTAVPRHYPEKRDRHNTYNRVLAARGVTVLRGHHVRDPNSGTYSEKQSDINVALSLILDGLDDVYDWAYLLTADSDQAATARTFSERLPNKKLVAVAPPGRRVPDKTLPFVESHFSLKKDHIEAVVLPKFVPGTSGNLIRRPAEYDPPTGWIHPDERP